MVDKICKWSAIIGGLFFLSLSSTVIAIECYGDTLLKNWYNDLVNLSFYQLISMTIFLLGAFLSFVYLLWDDNKRIQSKIAENNGIIKDLEKVVADLEISGVTNEKT